MPRDNNPTHGSTDDESNSRDNNPTTVRHGGGSTGFERECKACGHFGLDQREVPQPGGPKEKKVCPECGHVHDDERGHADRV